MKPSEFARLLFGDEPPGFIQVWELRGRYSFYERWPKDIDYYADGKTDVYIAVGLAHKRHGRKVRAKADQIIAIPGLWLDIDVNGGPNEKTGAAPSVDAALQLAHAIAPPTIVIHSGYGVHAWHLLHDVWKFTSYDDQAAAARAAAQWYALHRIEASNAGFAFDTSTRDLARLLRPPGTLNGKGGAKVPVTVLEHRGERFPLVQLLALAARAGDIAPVPTLQLSLDRDSGDDAVASTPVGVRLEALIANDDTFRDTWRCQRLDAPAWSMSEYNLSLATQLVAGDWNDRDIAEAIRLHRLRHDAGDTKGVRDDYVARTIARARTEPQRPAASARAADQLRELAETRRAA